MTASDHDPPAVPVPAEERLAALEAAVAALDERVSAALAQLEARFVAFDRWLGLMAELPPAWERFAGGLTERLTERTAKAVTGSLEPTVEAVAELSVEVREVAGAVAELRASRPAAPLAAKPTAKPEPHATVAERSELSELLRSAYRQAVGPLAAGESAALERVFDEALAHANTDAKRASRIYAHWLWQYASTEGSHSEEDLLAVVRTGKLLTAG